MSSIHIEKLYELYLASTGVTTDSRNVRNGNLFFALQGENFNGNKFALVALEKGAKYAVVSDFRIAEQNKDCYYVEDTLEAMSKLAHLHRTKLSIPLILITGTNGKTTTKELIAKVLAEKYRVLYTEGNLNNHIGLPLTLLRLSKKHEIAVIEAGASHMGEIAYLAQIADPDFGIITNIGRAHLEGFGSYEGVIKAKTELYDFLQNKKAIAFVNQDDPLLMKLSSGLNRKLYGNHKSTQGEETFTYGNILEEKDNPMLSFRLQKPKVDSIHTQLVGNYNLPNALAAVAIGSHFGINPTQVAHALETYQPSNHRSQLIGPTANDNIVVADVYNANPSSMLEAISNFINFPTDKRKIAILGDMLELGAVSQEEHQIVIDFIEKNKHLLEEVLLIGQEFKLLGHLYKTQKRIHFIDNTEELLIYLKESPCRKKAILLKASHGMHFEKLIGFF